MLTACLAAVLAVLCWPLGGGTDPPGSSGLVPTPRAGGLAVHDGDRSSAPVDAWARLRRRARRRRLADPWVADFAEVVAVGLAAGLDLPSAALASARSPGVVAGAPWLAGHLRDCVDGGRGVTTILEAGVDLAPQEQADLALLVAAWRVAERVGAAASAVTSSAASSIRGRRAAAHRTAVVVAGPRASMVLLSALPLAGPAVASLIGMPPSRLYDSAASRVLAVGGVLLTLLGWWWASTLLRRARRPGGTDDGAP